MGTIDPMGALVDVGRPGVATVARGGEFFDGDPIVAEVAATPTVRRTTTHSQIRRRRLSRCLASLKSRSAFVGPWGPGVP
jgi:hypothetical protein